MEPVVILAGGLGTRLTEETGTKPKPMVEIGGRPILWHIMKHYAHHGHREFYVALGYKGEVIKRFFHEYHAFSGDMTVSLRTGETTYQNREVEDWTVHLVETGPETMTGGRVKRLEKKLAGRRFMVTYGDGVADVDVKKLLAFHQKHGKTATVTAVRPPARFGGLVFEGDLVSEFTEKPQIGEGWINGGFMVFEPSVFSHMKDDKTILEADTLEELARQGQLGAYRHDRYWQCMDTLRDLRSLQSLWDSGKAPWRVWE